MLVELDRNKGSEEVVAVIAATSQPEQLDPAFYRCGRFDKVVYMRLPDDTSRRELLLQKTTLADDVRLEELVSRTKGHSHAEISELVEAAKLERKQGETLCMNDFEKVFRKIQAKATPERIAVLDEFDRQHSH
jgi:SpoVK/Ycf46/Vps4 family AAA+-type ATPase